MIRPAYKRQVRTTLTEKHRRILINYASLMDRSISGILNEVVAIWIEQLPVNIKKICNDEVLRN